MINPAKSCMSKTFHSSPYKSTFGVTTNDMFMSKDPLATARREDIRTRERARNKFVFIDPESSEDETGGTFTANPAEDIPRNKLTDKLARGL